MTQTSQTHYAKCALPEDEPAIRALLRDVAMDGDIHITLEREPNANLAAQVEGKSHKTVLVVDANTDQILGMGTRSIRPLYVNGNVQSVGYLGQLRASPGKKGIKRLGCGFQAIAALREKQALPYDITSIVADNAPAIRLLGRGLDRLPKYQQFSQLSTFIIPTSNKKKLSDYNIETAQGNDLGSLASCLQDYLRQYQFAPYWDEDILADKQLCNNLSIQDFLVIRNKGKISSCMAIWDQRYFKQVVINGYSQKMRILRAPLNTLFKVLGKPILPKAPISVNLAYLSHMAIENNNPDIFTDLVNQARYQAKKRGLDYLVVGLTDRHPLHKTVLSNFSCYRYNSNLYCVNWNEADTLPTDIYKRIPHVEVAIL